MKSSPSKAMSDASGLLRYPRPVQDVLMPAGLPPLDYPAPQPLNIDGYWTRSAGGGNADVSFRHRSADGNEFRVEVIGDARLVESYVAIAKISVATMERERPRLVVDLAAAVRSAVEAVGGDPDVAPGESYRSALAAQGIGTAPVAQLAAANVFEQLAAAVSGGLITATDAENFRFVRRLSSLISTKRPLPTVGDEQVGLRVRLIDEGVSRPGARVVGFLIDPRFRYSMTYERGVDANGYVFAAVSASSGQLSFSLTGPYFDRWAFVGEAGYNSRSATANQAGTAVLQLVNEHRSWIASPRHYEYHDTEYQTEFVDW